MATRRVCLVSDMHGYLPVIPPCDLLLLCGDNAPDFAFNDIGAIRQVIWYNTKFKDWLHSVQQQTDAAIFGIAGNHDFALFRHAISIDYDLPWTYLQDSGAEYEGLQIWGSPWVTGCDGWAFNLEPQQLTHRFGRIPDGIDILLLHGPPYGHCDWAPSGSPHFDLSAGEHAGSQAAVDAIERVQPQLVGFGHIHEGYGQSMVGNSSRLINASRVDVRYQPANAPVVVFMETK